MALRQLEGLRQLQTNTMTVTARIRSNCCAYKQSNSLALAMRDMAEGEEPYPLVAYRMHLQGSAQTRGCLRREAALAPVSGHPLSKPADPIREAALESSDRLFRPSRRGP